MNRRLVALGRQLLLALAASVACTAAQAVDIQISSFTDSPDPAVRGGPIDFTITFENSDADTANNVVLAFPLPANTQFVSASDSVVAGACTHDGATPGTVTCTYPTLLGTLASPTAGPTRTVTVRIRTTGASVTTLSSTVTATSSDPDSNAGNNSLGQNTTVNNGADLTAAMTGAPDPATGGGLVTWTVTGSNAGPNASGAVTYTTTLPSVLTYVAAGSGGNGWTCGAAGQTVTCTRAAVAVGAYPNLPIVTRITGVAGGTVTLSGSISSTVGDPDTSNNAAVASVTVNPGTDLTVAQAVPSPNPVAAGGASVTFTVQPNNLGPNAASAGANVTFPLPAGFAVTSATGSAGWTCASSGSPVTVTCTFSGSYASGAGGTLTIVATTPALASPTTYPAITATIAPNAGGPSDPNASNNSAARSLTVQPDGVDLSIAKSKSPTYVAVGSNITSTIVVANAGPRSAASGTITVTDALDPTKEQFVSFAGSNWSCTSTPPNVSCTYNAALGVASAPALTITTQALAAGVATNNATASYSGSPGDYNSANDTIGASVTVTAANQSPDLQVALSAATAGGTQTTVEVNETAITYTATLTNKPTGTAANAQGVTVTLSIPGRTTATNVTVDSVALGNSSGTSTATFACSGTGTGSTGNVSCVQTGGTQLAPGDVVTFTVTANRPMLDVTNVNATVSAVAAAQGDPDASNNQASVPITIAPIADIELVSKVLAANPVLAGTNATYTITLRNNGPSAAAGVQMADVFVVPNGDAGFTFLSAVASNGGTCSGLTANASYTTTPTPVLTCAWAAAVANGSTRTVTVVVRPNWQAGAAARTLDNTAITSTTTAEDSFGSQGAAANSKSLTLNINPAQVDVLVNNTDSPDPLGYDPGTPTNNDVTYTVGVTNSGPSLATGTGFTFTMTPPAGKTIVFRGDGSAAGVAAANPTGTIAGSICDQVGNSVTGPATLTVSCTFAAPGQLAAGATATRYLVFRVASPPTTGGDVYQTNATIVVNETDSNPANNSEGEQTTVRARADLSITKTPSLPTVQIRQPFAWTIAVVNNGPGDSQTTGLSDTLPAGMAYTGTPTYAISGGGATGSCSVTGQTMTCAFGVLVAGRTATVTVPVRMTAYPSGGTSQNCATATTSEVDPNSANNLSICSSVTVQRSSLAGTVFQDRDRAGANAGTPQSATSEPRIAGVSVALTGTDAYGNAVSLATASDGSGAYAFGDLSPADASGYTVTETQPAGFVNSPASPPTPASTGVYARGGAAGNTVWSQVALAGNTAGTGYDFPEVRRPTLSGFVYVDGNVNGVRDGGTDAVVAGATVRLLDASTLALVATATSDGTGAYAFAGLDPFTAYTLEEPLPASPAGLGNGPVNPGQIGGAACATGCTAQPNTPTAGTDRIASIDLSAGVDGTAFNFGELQQTTVSGLVFVDANRNNALDGGETGRLAGVTVRLVQGADCAGGTTLQTTTTAADGTWSFANVTAAQNYLVCETQPAGFGVGSANGTPNSNVIAITNLPTAGSPNNRFGETLAVLSGSVYQDYSAATPANNDNGVRDAGELGIVNVPVTLTGTDITGAPVSRSTVTDASGNWSFADLPQSDATGYTVVEGAIPAASGSYLDGRDSAGTLGGSTAVNDRVSGIVVPAGGTGTGVTFGELPIAPISGTVYLDRNRNNALDATPTDGRIAGVAVRLVQGASCAAGTTVQSTTTAADGGWAFSGAVAGQNYLVCETQPAGYGDGATTPGSGNTTPAANTIAIANLPAAGSSGNGFGERAGTVSGFVFLDANNDGARAGDAGIAGVVVTLTGVDAAGNAVSRSATTDGSGAYAFADVLGAGPGGYTLSEQAAQPVVAGRTTLNGRTVAGPAGGSATAPATTPSAIASIALAAGADAPENDFAEILPVGLSGTVFIDLNNNGVQNAPGDAGLANVTLTVTGSDDTGAAVSRTVTTAADGTWSIADLRPGTYTVTEPTQPPGTSNGQTLAGSAGGTPTPPATTPSAIAGIASTTPGTTGTNYNFAEIPNSSSIAGRVYLDANNNGAADAGETGLAGVTVELTGTDAGGAAVSRTATTDAQGNYAFSGLPPGTFTVREPAQPAGTLNGRTTAGPAGGTATPPSTTPSAISGIVLAVGTAATGNLFGELAGASIAGRVIADANDNGRLDAGEGGLANVTLVLTGSDDLGQAVNATATSDATGAYAFPSLRPGTYTVTEPTQPPGTVNGLTTAGTVAGATTGTATTPQQTPSAISGIVLPPGGASIGNDFAEVGNSPDLLVAKAAVESRFTVNNVGHYAIRVRNAGQVATSGMVTVRDRLPAGLTLDAVPTGTGWSCAGAAGAASFACTSSDVLAAGATNGNAITVTVRVAAAALQSSPVVNAVIVEGGGELPARGPSPAESDAFANTPSTLPACDPAIAHNACRTSTVVQASASVSGTVWYDIGSSPRLLDGGDRRLPGWTVEVVDGGGNVVARTVTAADGTWRIGDMLPGVALRVRFRDPQSNVVFGYPVNGESAPGSSGAACNTQGAIAGGTQSSCPGSGAEPALVDVLSPGQNLPQQSLPVDPSGVVYDSGTRQPVPGSVVTLRPVGTCTGYDPATSLVSIALGGYTVDGTAVSMTVGNDGLYQFLFSPSAPASCTFSLSVAPPAGFTFASAVIPPSSAPYTPGGSPGQTVAVQPQAGPPTGPVGPATVYYLTVVTGSASANLIHNHIPVDTAAANGLALSKTGDRQVVEVGDTVRYTLTVQRSSGPVPRQVSIVDRLPAGFTFVPGTVTVNGVSIADPAGKPGPTLVFQLGPMGSSGQLVLQYRARVGVGSQQGDGTNRAVGYGCGIPAGCTDASGQAPIAGSVATNPARYTVRITGGVFTTEACVAGKVFVDCNGNHVQDAEEIGIPGVRLVISDGTILVSDSEGKYSYCGLPPKSHVVRVDETTLPTGSRLTTSSNRNLGDAGSLWLDLKNGELHRADFVEGSCTPSVLDQIKARRAQGEVRSVETEKRKGPALRFDSADKGPKARTAPPADGDAKGGAK